MTSENGSSQLRESSRGLPWLARRFNQKLSLEGKQMCVPFDFHHPFGNHDLVNHEWSQEDIESFRSDGQVSLSTMTGRHWVNDTTPNAVVLRFIEGHTCKNGSTHEISGSYLMPLCEGQKQVFWVISTMTPEEHQKTPDADSYYIIPSGFTKASTLERQPKSKDPVNNYFTPSVHAIPGVARQPLCQGSALFADDKFDPLNHVVHINKFPELFAQLFDTSSGPEMSIPSTSATAPPNETFRKEDYLTLHREVHQGSWDFGLRFREY